jgi:hypothetical protein
MRDKKKDIDEVLTTLYWSDAGGYLGVDKVVLNSEAKRRIQRTLATLDAKTRQSVETEANYRLERFGKFKELPITRRTEILKVAKEKHISIEKAYELNDGARN